jgi:hypothetical protein
MYLGRARHGLLIKRACAVRDKKLAGRLGNKVSKNTNIDMQFTYRHSCSHQLDAVVQ